MSEIVLITNKDFSGGALYEKLVYEIIKQKYTVDFYQLNSSSSKFYPNKLFLYNQLKNIDTRNKILITNKSFIYGLNINNNNKKILIFHHFDYKNEKLLNKIFENILQKKTKKFDKIVCVAEYWKNFLIERNIDLKEENIKVIYNSFNINKFFEVKQKKNREGFCKKYSIPEDKILVYGGNSAYLKGTDILVSQLNKEKFFIITSGNRKEKYNTLHFNLTYDEYIELLANVDVTVLLSRMLEGWNRIAHESILAGTPVIGTDVAGLGELLRKAGQVIFDDKIPLSEQIEFMINNRKKLFEMGFAFLSNFNLDYFEKEWVQLIS